MTDYYDPYHGRPRNPPSAEDWAAQPSEFSFPGLCAFPDEPPSRGGRYHGKAPRPSTYGTPPQSLAKQYIR